jgi:putative lipoic acid-binding regulatory protein
MDVLKVVRLHVDNLAENAIKTRPSGKGNYISITVTINAHSKQQIDNIYLGLNACESVLMCL